MCSKILNNPDLKAAGGVLNNKLKFIQKAIDAHQLLRIHVQYAVQNSELNQVNSVYL